MKKISLIFSIVSMLLITACSNPKTEPTAPLTDTDKWLNKVKGKSVDFPNVGVLRKATFTTDGKTVTLIKGTVDGSVAVDRIYVFEKIINENKAIYKMPEFGSFHGFEIKEGALHTGVDVATEDAINWGDTINGELK